MTSTQTLPSIRESAAADGGTTAFLGTVEAPVLGGSRRMVLEKTPAGIAVAVPREPTPGLAFFEDDDISRRLTIAANPLDELAVDVDARFHPPFRVPLEDLRALDPASEYELGEVAGDGADVYFPADHWSVVGVLQGGDLGRARTQLLQALDDADRFDALPWVSSKQLYRTLSRATRATLAELPIPLENLTDQALAVDRRQAVCTRRFQVAMARIQARMLCDEKGAALVTGDAGVGKSTLFFALAEAVVRGRFAGRLRSTTIVEIDPALFARAAKADLDPANHAILQSLRALARLDVIVLVDEAHALDTTHNRQSDALTALKPLITRHGLRIVLATNVGERLKGWDDALDSRFGEPIRLLEADRAELVEEILPAKAQAARQRHGIETTEAALDAVVGYAELVGGCAHPRASVDMFDGTRALAEAAVLPRVTASLVQAAAWDRMGRDPSLTHDEDTWVEQIAGRVVGHRRVIREIVRALMAYEERLLRPGTRPIVKPFVAILGGPPGVGKTSLAEAVQEVCFPGGGEILKIEGADFKRHEHLSRLLGSPPGYVGHGGDGGELIKHIKNHPRSVIEISEAEDGVVELLTRVVRPLLTGSIKSNEGGNAVATRGITLFLTTNADSVGRPRRVGIETSTTPAESARAGRIDAIRGIFPARVFSRIGESSVFLVDGLSRDELLEVTRRLLTELQERERVTLHVEQGVPEVIVDAATGVDRNGVPSIERAVDRLVHQPLLAWLREHRDSHEVLLRPGDGAVSLFHVIPETGEFHA